MSNRMKGKKTQKLNQLVYCGIQIMGTCLLVKWFAIQMPWYKGSSVFRSSNEYRSAIQMPSIMVPGI